jgi:hypothetical protein
MVVELLLSLGQAAAPTQAADSALRDALRPHRHPIGLDPSWRLTGTGGDLVLREGAAAQFVLVGEEHGVAEIPVLTAALARALAPAGYRHFAIEIGAELATRLNQLAMGPGAESRLAQFSRDHFPGVPFYALREEASLLAVTVAAMGSRPDVLWGLDYDIVGDRWAMRRLREIAPNPGARAAADAAIRLADSLVDRALARKNPGLIMMFGGSDSVFRALRDAYRPGAGSEADRHLSLMQETLAINQLWIAGRALASNERRGRLMKAQLAGYLNRAVPRDSLPRVLFKFGASHMMRGRTLTNIFDVGGTAAELAELHGGRTFHLLVVGGPGSRHAQVDPTTFLYREMPGDLSSGSLAALGPLATELLPEGWTLFDLRPLRPGADRLTQDARLTQIIFGFDAVAILAGSGPSHSLVTGRHP